MSITEYCPHNNSWISTNWTISSFTKLSLPITSKLVSEKFNCSAVSLKSSETKEVHFSNHHMKILEQHWEEEKVNFNQTKFIRSNITLATRSTTLPTLESLNPFSNLKVPLLCAGGAAFLILLIVIITKLAVSWESKGVNVNVQNSNTATNDNSSSPPSAPQKVLPIIPPLQPDMVRQYSLRNKELQADQESS